MESFPYNISVYTQILSPSLQNIDAFFTSPAAHRQMLEYLQ